jgi:agmatine deiminase
MELNVGDRSWLMPAEWEEHERTWMAWPSSGYTLGETVAEANEARACWAAVANAIVRFEPVTVVVDSSDMSLAREWLDDAVELLEADLDDAWMRDIGPSFVRGADGKLAGVNWVFNGWGGQQWASWEKDSLIASRVSAASGIAALDSPLVNEGGGIHVNGAGTLLVTETVQLDAGRNPGWSRNQVEVELKRTLGADRIIWMPRGLTRDYDEFGTRGHIDIVACFANENTVLFHDQRNAEHPDFWISAETRRVLKAVGKTPPGSPAEEVSGVTGKLKVVAVPAPDVLQDDQGWVDFSYINHYICNGAVILCAFDDPGDARARKILKKAYPGREIVLVDARPLFDRGGGIHCITQQQPKA